MSLIIDKEDTGLEYYVAKTPHTIESGSTSRIKKDKPIKKVNVVNNVVNNVVKTPKLKTLIKKKPLVKDKSKSVVIKKPTTASIATKVKPKPTKKLTKRVEVVSKKITVNPVKSVNVIKPVVKPKTVKKTLVKRTTKLIVKKQPPKTENKRLISGRKTLISSTKGAKKL